jgi:putative methyltransferase (TIGR04325 family)
MRTTGLHEPPVRFAVASEGVDQCDLLYCNSVLQYFGSNAELLDLAQNGGPRHILLDDLLATDGDDFFTTQLYYDTVIPCRFVGLDRLTAELEGIGYTRLMAVPFATPILGMVKPLPMENFPAERRVSHPLSVLFERRGSAATQVDRRPSTPG